MARGRGQTQHMEGHTEHPGHNPGFTVPQPSSLQRDAASPLSFPGISPPPWPPQGSPAAFHRCGKRRDHRHPRDKAPRQGNNSPKAAASWPPQLPPHCREHGQPGEASMAQREPHRGQHSMLHPHLQTSQTAPAGWTGRWLQSLEQGESTASQISQNSPGTTWMHPSPILPLHQPP